MRIAEIAPPWFPVPPEGYGGSERVVSELTDGLVARGHDVTLFASGGSQTTATLVSPMSVPPDPRDLGNSWDDLFHAYSAYAQAGEFDVIHDHSGLIGPVLGSMLERCPPIVHTLHGPWTDQSRRHYALIDRRVHLVAISHAQRASNTNIRYAGVVHNGLDPTRFPFRSVKENFLAFLGRSSPDKGPVEAIEIARRVGLPLVMMIKVNEPDEHEYWDDVIRPNLGDHVEVLQNVTHNEKVDLLGRAKAMVFPIQWEEPFGLVMIEAMACGTPVVASKMGSVPEVVVDGVTGFMTDPTSPVESSVAALANIDAIDPARCRAHVERTFGASVMTEGYERIFERVDQTVIADVRNAPRARVALGGDKLIGTGTA